MKGGKKVQKINNHANTVIKHVIVDKVVQGMATSSQKAHTPCGRVSRLYEAEKSIKVAKGLMALHNCDTG